MAAGSRFRPATLIVGNFLSCSLGNRAVCEELSENLRQRGWRVMTASSRAAPLRRLGDMLSTVVSSRHEYRVAQWMCSAAGLFLGGGGCIGITRCEEAFCVDASWRQPPGLFVPVAQPGAWPVAVGPRRDGPVPSSIGFDARYRRDLILLPNPLDLSAFPFRLRAQAKPRLIWLRAFHRKYNPTMAPRVLAALVRNSRISG